MAPTPLTIRWSLVWRTMAVCLGGFALGVVLVLF